MRILLVSYYAPPSRSTGARRPANLAKALRRKGFDVTVLTSSVSGSPHAGTRVAPDLMTSRLNWRRRNLDALVHSDAATYAEASAVADVFPPDPQILTWAPSAAMAIRQILRREVFDCAITTSPPQSVHTLGPIIRRAGVPWIADLRDGWNFERLSPPSRFRAVRSIDARLERATLRRASALTAVTDGIATDLRQRFSQQPVRVITNGFDPDERNTAPYRQSSDGYSIVYTGAIQTGARGHDLLQPFLEGVRMRASETTGISVTLAGPLTASERERCSAFSDVCSAVGVLDRASTVALQRTADLLVVLIGDGKPGVATGKVFEYLAANRPILVVGSDSAAADIVRRCRAGRACDNNAVEIARALRDLQESRAFEPDHRTVDEYSWTSLGDRFAELIADVVARGRPR